MAVKNYKRYIEVTFQREGVHRYPEAENNPDLADVSFLANLHRHIFHFRVRVSVNHNDRDIEFIQFKRWLESQYSEKLLKLDYKSCEMIAEDLIEKVEEKYSPAYIEIGVSEDAENGAVVISEKA